MDVAGARRLPVWDPGPFVQPRPSFTAPVTGPASGPCDAPLACVSINVEYLKFIAGAMSQLVQRTTWLATDEDDLQRILANMTWAIELIGTAVQCEQPPAIGLPGQRACNISGYLAQNVIRQSMAQAIAAIQNNYNVLWYGTTILSFIPGGGGIFGVLMGVLNSFYHTISSGTLSDYQTAVNDDTLWSAVTCNINFNIAADGQVTAANYPAIVTALCAMPYSLPDVRDAICNYVSGLGAAGLQALQPAGALADFDCSNCSGTGPVIGPTGPQPTRIKGRAIVEILVGAADAILPILFPSPFPNPPLLTMGTDNEQLIVSYENVTTTGFDARLTAAVPVGTATTGTVDYVAEMPGQQ